MSELPKSIWSGTLTIFGVELICHLLDDGQRIFEAEGLERLFAGEGVVTDSAGDMDALAKFMRGVGIPSTPPAETAPESPRTADTP